MKKIVSKESATNTSSKKVISDSHDNYTIVSDNKSLSGPRFKIKDYKTVDKYNYLSFGQITGKYYIENKVDLYKSILKGELHHYCLIDLKSPFYPLFYDLDMDLVTLSLIPNIDIFWDNLIKTIQKAILYYAVEVNVKYIYSDRSDKKVNKLHIYFPGVIVDNVHALCIRSKVLELLGNSKIDYSKILDASVYKSNGLRLMYQRKRYERGYYKINHKLSTWSDIPKSRLERMLLLSLKTDHKSINFKLSHSLPVIKKKVKKVKKVKNISIINTSLDSPDDINVAYITDLFNNLSASRLDSYGNWIKCLMLCRNHGLVNLAHSISSRSSKYNATEVNKIIRNRKSINNPLTIKSLESWSKADNLLNHIKILDTYTPKIPLDKYLKPKLLKCFYSDLYVKSLIENIDFEKTFKRYSYGSFVMVCSNYGWLNYCIEHCPSNYSIRDVYGLLEYCKSGRSSRDISSIIKWSMKSNIASHKLIESEYKDNPLKYRFIVDYRDGKYLMERRVHRYNFSSYDNYEERSVKYLSDISGGDYDTIILKSGTGSNKTGVCLKWILDMVDKGYKGICILCSRVVLCTNMESRCKSALHGETENRPITLGMVNYNSVKNKRKNLCKYDRLIQTVDSLVLMYGDGKSITIPEILFIDEIQSLFDYVVNSDTLCDKRKKVWDILINYIKYAKKLVAVDSNISESLCRFILKLRSNGRSKVIFNRRMTDSQSYYIRKNESEVMKNIEEDIVAGKKLYICTDSKKKSENLYEALSKYNLRMILYNSDTSDVEKNKLGDLDKLWVNYDIIIVSPTILYGCDFSVRDHIDRIYCFIRGSVAAAGCLQQIRRIRFPASGEVVICVNVINNYNEDYPVDDKGIKEMILEMKEKSMSRVTDIVTLMNARCESNLDLDDLYTQLYIQFMKTRNKSMSNYVDELIHYMTEYGGKVYREICKKRSDKVYTKECDVIDKKISEKEIKDILKCESSAVNVKELRYKFPKSRLEKILMRGVYIKEVFGLDRLTESFLRDLGHISNVGSFYDSLVYVGSDEYRRGRNEDIISNEIGLKYEILRRKRLLISELVGMYWGNGILSIDEIEIYSKDKLSAGKKRYVKNNMSVIRELFPSMKLYKKPVNDIQLIRVCNMMCRSYFGGFVNILVSKSLQKRVKKKRVSYKKIKIESLRYIELILNKKKDMLSDDKIEYIKENYDMCVYKDLHNCDNIKLLIEKEDVYMFDKVDNNIFSDDSD